MHSRHLTTAALAETASQLRRNLEEACRRGEITQAEADYVSLCCARPRSSLWPVHLLMDRWSPETDLDSPECIYYVRTPFSCKMVSPLPGTEASLSIGMSRLSSGLQIQLREEEHEKSAEGKSRGDKQSSEVPPSRSVEIDSRQEVRQRTAKLRREFAADLERLEELERT